MSMATKSKSKKDVAALEAGTTQTSSIPGVPGSEVSSGNIPSNNIFGLIKEGRQKAEVFLPSRLP